MPKDKKMYVVKDSPNGGWIRLQSTFYGELCPCVGGEATLMTSDQVKKYSNKESLIYEVDISFVRTFKIKGKKLENQDSQVFPKPSGILFPY